MPDDRAKRDLPPNALNHRQEAHLTGPPRVETPSPPHDRASLLKAAMADHGAGRAAEAERLYRQLLQVNADDAEVLHLLGLLLHQSGNAPAQGEALAMVRRSLELAASRPHVHSNFA